MLLLSNRSPISLRSLSVVKATFSTLYANLILLLVVLIWIFRLGFASDPSALKVSIWNHLHQNLLHRNHSKPSASNLLIQVFAWNSEFESDKSLISLWCSTSELISTNKSLSYLVQKSRFIWSCVASTFDVRIEKPRSFSLTLADHFEIHPVEDFQQIKELGEIETEQLLRR